MLMSDRGGVYESRVMGGQPSEIDGRLQLQSTIQGANLFLLNPSGVIFGHCCPARVRRHIAVDLLDLNTVEDGIHSPSCVGRIG